MLRAVNWGEKLGHVFGGHHGRILRILLLFLCALGVLVVIYRARTERINKENATARYHQKSAASSSMPSASSIKWVIVANPDSEEGSNFGSGDNYVCSVALVARSAGWKTIIIGQKLNCCRTPDCYSISKHQFLKMSYKTASVIKNLMDSDSGVHSQAYKETIRNLAFLWAMHRGARYVFDAYVEEYQSAGVKISKFEEEFSRQLNTLALDESLALVEERSRSRANVFRNPYSHFGRPDVRLLPGGTGSGSGSSSHQHTLGHVLNYNQYTTFNLDHGHGHPNPSMKSSHKNQEYPTFRICEVRPPSIEKFLEIDEGWWDLRAPALVLPGDTMPPLCTRNTLFSPEVFWALPLLPDYSAGESDGIPADVPQNVSRIPPWYIRGLWSQSLLGDLGGSIRLTLSRVPTLQVFRNQDSYAAGATSSAGDYDPSPSKESMGSSNRTASSKLLKRWHCRSRSTFRCLLLMAKELSKSVYMGTNDVSLIEAWVMDLKQIHYAEPPMLPKRRSHANPCLGADGLHGVSFYPALEPSKDFSTEEFIGNRNDTLKHLIAQQEGHSQGSRDKRETAIPSLRSDLALNLTAPEENATFAPVDWSTYVSDGDKIGEQETPLVTSAVSTDGDTYVSAHEVSQQERVPAPLQEQEKGDSSYRQGIYEDGAEIFTYSRRVLPLVDKPVFPSMPGFGVSPAGRTGKQFRAFLQEVAAKSSEGGAGDFPILKAIAENMCKGYGDLIPYKPQTTYEDTLLIVVFTNQHYDLIPTLEVIYRSAFPNMLYCGHPHESVEIFLRKYQSTEHRSFSFLPTYTRATYECVLGAMEMNYEVKGYMVVTDETLMNTWNLQNLDSSKIWVSSSGYDKVTRNSWSKLDPGGQKLPRLLDGIVATWKLFSYILVGQDSYQFLEPRGIKKRSLTSLEDEVPPPPPSSTSNNPESFETGESAYIPGPAYRWDQKINETDDGFYDEKNSTKEGDLLPSDFDYLKGTLFANKGQANGENDTSLPEDTAEEEVFVGEHDEDNRPMESQGLEDAMLVPSSSPAPEDKSTDSIMGDPMLVTPTEESLENSTVLWPMPERKMAEDGSAVSSTTSNPESAVGVPLYHVEHVEPPTPATWHKPDEVSSTAPTMEKERSYPEMNSERSVGSDSDSRMEKEASVPTSSPSSTERVTEAVTVSSTLSSAAGEGSAAPLDPAELELKGDMEALLEILHDVYVNMIALVGSYQENNEELRNQEYSSEGMDASRLEESRSHRISPREFRHIRCTLVDDGHQSELCSTLRDYINLLGLNIGRDIRIFHDTIPMYYLPSWTTKPFYSVANVLLHYGVMDELALPLLFRGLSLESDWVHLNRTQSDILTEPKGGESSTSEDSLKSLQSLSDTQYIHPFSLHKVYTDTSARHAFCAEYLLRDLQL